MAEDEREAFAALDAPAARAMPGIAEDGANAVPSRCAVSVSTLPPTSCSGVRSSPERRGEWRVSWSEQA